MSARLSRRSFLALAGVVVVGGGAAAARLLGGEDTDDLTGPARTAAMLFDDPEAARRVGERWLELNPAENDPELLVTLLSRAQPGLGRALAAGDVPTTRRLARQRAAHELGAGDLRHLDAWLVSATEVRLAALLAA